MLWFFLIFVLIAAISCLTGSIWASACCRPHRENDESARCCARPSLCVGRQRGVLLTAGVRCSPPSGRLCHDVLRVLQPVMLVFGLISAPCP
ncbi:MAG: hypothetical protein ACLSGS_09145 [Adlercreutzia sp.]